MKKHFLRNNDVVELGKYKLKYVSDQPNMATAGDFEKTMLIRPNVMKAAETPKSLTESQPAGLATSVVPIPTPADAPAPPPLPTAAIQLLTGANAGKELELTKTLTTLGKPGVQVAVIARRPHGFFITHVEGTQFPIVNGSVLDAQARQLADHDVIEIAGIKMEFFFKT